MSMIVKEFRMGFPSFSGRLFWSVPCLQLDSVQMMRCFFIRNPVFAVNQMFFSLHTPPEN